MIAIAYMPRSLGVAGCRLPFSDGNGGARDGGYPAQEIGPWMNDLDWEDLPHGAHPRSHDFYRNIYHPVESVCRISLILSHSLPALVD